MSAQDVGCDICVTLCILWPSLFHCTKHGKDILWVQTNSKTTDPYRDACIKMIIGRNETGDTWRLSHLKMHKIMFKNSAGNNATLCSLVSTASQACCSLRYHHAAKMCLSERLHFNNFIPYFSPQNKNVHFLNIILADSWSQRLQMVSLLIIDVKIFIFLLLLLL